MTGKKVAARTSAQPETRRSIRQVVADTATQDEQETACKPVVCDTARKQCGDTAKAHDGTQRPADALLAIFARAEQGAARRAAFYRQRKGA